MATRASCTPPSSTPPPPLAALGDARELHAAALDLPLASPFPAYRGLPDDLLQERIEAVRRRLGPRLVILGHHYQQDGVIAHADFQGDSYQLSRSAAERDECEAIAFCGVHFMAETADILANRPDKVAARGGRRVTVVLPDLAAGCSMADMAAITYFKASGVLPHRRIYKHYIFVCDPAGAQYRVPLVT